MVVRIPVLLKQAINLSSASLMLASEAKDIPKISVEFHVRPEMEFWQKTTSEKGERP